MEPNDAAPYHVNLDPERALELAKSGGSILLLNVPPTTILGLDVEVGCSDEVYNLLPTPVTRFLFSSFMLSCVGFNFQMFVLGPNFKGVKMLPPGPHFLYYSSSSK